MNNNIQIHKKLPNNPKPIKYPQKNRQVNINPGLIYRQYFNTIFSLNNIKITSNILSYLDYKDILSIKKISKSFYELISSHKVMKQYVLYGTISQSERALFYETNLNIKESKQKVIKELIEYEINDNIYNNILKLANNLCKKDKKFYKITQEIKKDVHRTFQTEKFKN